MARMLIKSITKLISDTTASCTKGRCLNHHAQMRFRIGPEDQYSTVLYPIDDFKSARVFR